VQDVKEELNHEEIENTVACKWHPSDKQKGAVQGMKEIQQIAVDQVRAVKEANAAFLQLNEPKTSGGFVEKGLAAWKLSQKIRDIVDEFRAEKLQEKKKAAMFPIEQLEAAYAQARDAVADLKNIMRVSDATVGEGLQKFLQTTVTSTERVVPKGWDQMPHYWCKPLFFFRGKRYDNCVQHGKCFAGGFEFPSCAPRITRYAHGSYFIGSELHAIRNNAKNVKDGTKSFNNLGQIQKALALPKELGSGLLKLFGGPAAKQPEETTRLAKLGKLANYAGQLKSAGKLQSVQQAVATIRNGSFMELVGVVNANNKQIKEKFNAFVTENQGYLVQKFGGEFFNGFLRRAVLGPANAADVSISVMRGVLVAYMIEQLAEMRSRVGVLVGVVTSSLSAAGI